MSSQLKYLIVKLAFMKLLSDRLKWAMGQKSQRDGYDVSPADVARAAKVSDTSASYWLSDTTGISAVKARLVADYLGVNAMWIETGKGEPDLDYVPGPAANDADMASFDEAYLVMTALRDGDEIDRSMLVDLARTINTRAAVKRSRAADKS